MLPYIQSVHKAPPNMFLPLRNEYVPARMDSTPSGDDAIEPAITPGGSFVRKSPVHETDNKRLKETKAPGIIIRFLFIFFSG